MSEIPPSPPPAPAAETAAPATEAELCALVRACAEARQPLWSEGRGTKRHHGPATAPEARRLSLQRLAAVTAYEPGDMVVSVQAGLRLAELQRHLAQRGQWLPVDPPYADATVGGILATGSAGPRRLGYGNARDFVLGMRVVGATGEITKSGGRVVKNVSGFDLHKLQVGAMGSLGVMLEVNLKVATRPAQSGALLLACPTLAGALALLLEVRALPLRPVALEALDAGAASPLRGQVPEMGAAGALAIIGIEGSRAAFDRHVRDLAALRGRAASSALIDGPAAEWLWSTLRDAPAERVNEVTVRLGARPHELPGLLEACDPGAAGATAVSCHAGTGIARVSLPAGEPAASIIHRCVAWHERAVARQGYAVVESAPLALPGRASLPWGRVEHGIGQSLKQAWDPNRILNPGRMVA